MWIREMAYRLGWFKSYRANVPVISVGNIHVGGTGKTPFTIYLAKKFTQMGKKVAVISRGYGRDAKGYFLVSNGTAQQANTRLHGDEPVLIAKSVAGCIVAVCEKRAIAIKKVEKQFQPDLFILDDGFQHLAVKRDVDIVLMREEQKLENRLVIPAGRLREFKSRIKRATFIVNSDGNEQVDRFFTKTYSDFLYNIQFNEKRAFSLFRRQKVMAFCGIAQPENFRKLLQKKGVDPIHFISFADHYRYTIKDVEKIISLAHKNSINKILCTEKDLVKIAELDMAEKLFFNAKIDLYAPVLHMEVKDADTFIKKIKMHLTPQ